MKGPFRDNCLRYFYLGVAFLMAGCVEGSRRALVRGLVLTAGTHIEQTSSVGPLYTSLIHSLEKIDIFIVGCLFYYYSCTY